MEQITESNKNFLSQNVTNSKVSAFHHKKVFSDTDMDRLNRLKFNSFFLNQQIGPEVFNNDSQIDTCLNTEMMQCDYYLPHELKKNHTIWT